MKVMVLEVYERTHKFGYLYWKKKDDSQISDGLRELSGKKVEVIFNKISLGKKHIDIKNRRISLGKKLTLGLSVGSKLNIIKKHTHIEVIYK